MPIYTVTFLKIYVSAGGAMAPLRGTMHGPHSPPKEGHHSNFKVSVKLQPFLGFSYAYGL